MLNEFKNNLLFGYDKLSAKTIFREINKENGYEEDFEKDGGDIVINYLQFNDGYTVFAVIPELMAFIKVLVKSSIDGHNVKLRHKKVV